MKYGFATLLVFGFTASLTIVPRAEAGHSLRIDEGNGAGCMSTYTANGDATNVFTPGGTYLNSVACTPNSSSPADLFPNGTATNDSATFDSTFTATGGEMFQYYTNAIGPQPDAQVALWNLPVGPFGATTEIELNGWCPGGSGASFTLGGNTFSGGCNGTSTDLLFQSGSIVGYVTDASDGTAIIVKGAAVPGWTESGVVTSAPELDPSSLIAGLTLLLGSLAVVRGRRVLLAPSVA
jgi:hypothetical protein